MCIESQAEFTWREEVTGEDASSVRKLCEMSGKFSAAEIEVAEELVRERLGKGPSSGYLFCFVEQEGKPLGYACYGPVPGTLASWDLYWIVVAGNRQGGGLGSAILARVEKSIRQGGGKSVWVDTSSQEGYRPTRAFYRARGYENQAVLTDFYRPGDHKVILCKRLGEAWAEDPEPGK